MSYLLPPRLHFAGRFQADVSTVNNDPLHFDTRAFRANYDAPGPSNGSWNPMGTGAWRFVDCTVRQVVYADGSSTADPLFDDVIGAEIRSAEARVAGKIVDLDPQHQMVSEIWGFQVGLHAKLAQGGIAGFTGEFEEAAFADIWKRFPNGHPDSMFGAFYQSILNLVDWQGGESRFLKELSAAGNIPRQLSIRFNLDGFDDDRSSPTFTFGRVTGSIGLYVPGEPHHFIAGRALNPAASSPLKTAYAQIHGGMLWLDLGNSIPTTSPGGPLDSSLSLYAAILPVGQPPVILGKIPLDLPDWYGKTSGIVGIHLDAGQLQQAASAPLALVQMTAVAPAPQTVLAEAADGAFVRADDFVFRFDPGDSRTTRMYVTAFGAPAANKTIQLIHDSSFMGGKGAPGAAVSSPPVGVPKEALRFPQSVTTGSDGTAEVKLEAGDPGDPRRFIDGQVYCVNYGLGNAPPALGSNRNPSRMLNALVFSGYKVPHEPTWLEDVQPILQRYDNLFPAMRAVVDLSNFASVIGRLGILRRVFDLPVSDANYMPVTRDLSGTKRAMIRKWLANPVYMRLDSLDDLKLALQLAIEVEHATIPPYLCALYSIKDGANPEVAGILRDIVMQEMLHMARVANLLIALGGKPKMDDPAFVPRYPGPMPAGLRGGLTVRLRRCSILQIRDVFMSMEEPERTVAPGSITSYGGPVKPHLFTIGWFYDEIGRALNTLYKDGQIAFGHADEQVAKWPGPPKLAGSTEILVTDIEQAREALKTITQQGESTVPLEPSAFGDEIGHYYRFLEIVEGRRIVIDPHLKTFTFTGDHIPFDPTGVWPMMDDPDVTSLAPGSRAYILARQFSQQYHALLKGLHRTFNGQPDYLGEALGLMYALNMTARELVQTPSGRDDGTTAGPTFQIID